MNYSFSIEKMDDKYKIFKKEASNDFLYFDSHKDALDYIEKEIDKLNFNNYNKDIHGLNKEKTYIVKVDDNFSPGSDIWENGRYKTYEEALEKCKEITKDSFDNYKETWFLYGEDPFIVCEGGILEDGQTFSAREYVETLK